MFFVAGRSPRQFVVRFQAWLHMPHIPGNHCRLLDTGKPASEEEFLAVNGTGKVKLERYGRASLEVIAGDASI